MDLEVEVQNLNLIPPNNLTTASDYKFTYFYNLLPSAQALLQQATHFLQSDVFAPEQANVLFRRVNLKFLEFEKIPEGFKPDFYMKVIEVKESLILLLEDLNARYKIVQIPFSYSTILNREDSASSSKSLQPFERNNSQTTGVISSRIKQEPVDSDSGSKSPQYTHHTKKESTDFDQKSSYFDRKPPKQKPLTPIEQAKYFIKMFTACDDILTQVKNTSEKVHFHFKKFFGTPVNEYKAVFKLPDRIEEPLPLSDPNHIYHTFQLPGKFMESISIHCNLRSNWNQSLSRIRPYHSFIDQTLRLFSILPRISTENTTLSLFPHELAYWKFTHYHMT